MPVLKHSQIINYEVKMDKYIFHDLKQTWWRTLNRAEVPDKFNIST